MTAAELLSLLLRLDVRLKADGNRLKVDAPRGALTLALREALAARKAELVALLRAAPGRPCPCCGCGRWWLSIQGRWVCQTCHPPAVPELVALEHEAWDEALAERLVRETVHRCAETYERVGPPWPLRSDLDPIEGRLDRAWECRDMAALRQALADYEAAVKRAVEQHLRGEVA